MNQKHHDRVQDHIRFIRNRIKQEELIARDVKTKISVFYEMISKLEDLAELAKKEDGAASPKQTRIIVNGKPFMTTVSVLDYNAICRMVYGQVDDGHQYGGYTVTYKASDTIKGSLNSGESVALYEGMVFNVAVTRKA